MAQAPGTEHQHSSQVEDPTVLRLAGLDPYDPAVEKRCKPLVEASPHELAALLAGHEMRKAEALSDHARQLAVAARQVRDTAASCILLIPRFVPRALHHCGAACIHSYTAL